MASGASGDAGGITEHQRQSAMEVLESLLEDIAGDGPANFRSVEYGSGSEELGFNARRGSVMVEFRTRANAADETPDMTQRMGGLVDLSDHTPLREAGEKYATLERDVIELVAETIPGVPSADALDPVTVWPVTSEAGLYRVGFDLQAKTYLYAAAFKIPASTMG